MLSLSLILFLSHFLSLQVPYHFRVHTSTAKAHMPPAPGISRKTDKKIQCNFNFDARIFVHNTHRFQIIYISIQPDLEISDVDMIYCTLFAWYEVHMFDNTLKKKGDITYYMCIYAVPQIYYKNIMYIAYMWSPRIMGQIDFSFTQHLYRVV